MEYLQDSQFTFLLTANSDNAPLPEDAVEIAGIKAARVTVTGENDINKAFGNITFTEPGTRISIGSLSRIQEKMGNRELSTPRQRTR